uniref:Putative secreted peptide n=1 Tax=Anopheles braziliensis TaxID=58242 RepID=A0A2M3ZW41_9DIPT
MFLVFFCLLLSFLSAPLAHPFSLCTFHSFQFHLSSVLPSHFTRHYTARFHFPLPSFLTPPHTFAGWFYGG